MSSGIGAAAEVLVNLYLNDHRPKTQATSPDLVRKCAVSLHLKVFGQPPKSMGGAKGTNKGVLKVG